MVPTQLGKTLPKSSPATATLTRTYSGPDCTLGQLVVGDQVFATLEPPWLNNQRNISCVPSGDYPLLYLPRSASGRYKRVYHVADVANRGGILIHSGNVPANTLGCLLVGMKHGNMAGGKAVLNSRTALQAMRDLMGTDPGVLRIEGDYDVDS